VAAGYVLRLFTCPKAVTHPTTNRAECMTSLLVIFYIIHHHFSITGRLYYQSFSTADKSGTSLILHRPAKTRILQIGRRKGTALPHLFVVAGVRSEVKSAGKRAERPLLLTSRYPSTNKYYRLMTAVKKNPVELNPLELKNVYSKRLNNEKIVYTRRTKRSRLYLYYFIRIQLLRLLCNR